MTAVSYIKPFLLGAFCTAMLGSCSETVGESGEPRGSRPISFAATENWGDAKEYLSQAQASRATVDGAFAVGDTMGVSAYYLPDGKEMAQAVPDFMYNQPITLTNAGWSYAPVKYWPAAGSLSFFAYYPYKDSGVTLSANTATGYPVLHYKNSKADTDLLAAQTGAITQANLTGGKIPLAFKHLLAKVNISFTYQGNASATSQTQAGATGSYRPLIHMIRFNIPEEGTYSYEGQTGGVPSWTNVSTTTTPLTRYTLPEGVSIVLEKQKIDEFTSYILPATLDKFEVAINNAIVSYTPPTPVEIKAGKDITLNFTIAPADNENSVFITSYTMWEDGGEITGDLH